MSVETVSGPHLQILYPFKCRANRTPVPTETKMLYCMDTTEGSSSSCHVMSYYNVSTKRTLQYGSDFQLASSQLIAKTLQYAPYDKKSTVYDAPSYPYIKA